MFINSGKGSDLTTLLGVTHRTSVLSSFFWSLLDNIQVLISDTHFSTQRLVEAKLFTYRIYIPSCHQHKTLTAQTWKHACFLPRYCITSQMMHACFLLYYYITLQTTDACLFLAVLRLIQISQVLHSSTLHAYFMHVHVNFLSISVQDCS